MADDKSNEEEGEEEKAKSKLPLIIGVVVLVAAAAGGGAFFGGAFDEKPVATDEAAEPEPIAKIPAQYIKFKPEFVANYKVNGKTHYLKINISVMVREDDARLAVDQHMPSLRNALVMLFAEADYESLKSSEGKEKLRDDALKSMQEIVLAELGKAGIEQVLFTDFVLQ